MLMKIRSSNFGAKNSDKLTFKTKSRFLARKFNFFKEKHSKRFSNFWYQRIKYVSLKVKFCPTMHFGPKLVFWVECMEYIFFNVLPYKDQKSFRDWVVWDLKEPKFGLLLTNMSIITFLLLWKTEIEKSFPILMIVYPKRRRAE